MRGDDLGSMTFPPEKIEAQIEAVQAAGFDMHIHVDADGSARVVSMPWNPFSGDVVPKDVVTIAHNSMVAPDDINRYAQLGIIANCTPLWGTDYKRSISRHHTTLLGAETGRRAVDALPGSSAIGGHRHVRQ